MGRATLRMKGTNRLPARQLEKLTKTPIRVTKAPRPIKKKGR